MESPLNYLLEHSIRVPSHPALTVSGETLSYRELMDEVAVVASFFEKHSVGKGTKVAIYTDNPLFLVKSMFASWLLGACCVPVNVTQNKYIFKEIGEIASPDIGFSLADPDGIATTGYPVVMFEAAGTKPSCGIRSIAIEPDQTCMIMFTSGSSGIPKAVPWTHHGLWYNTFFTAKRLRISSTDRLFINTPPYTASSILHILTMMSNGASVVIDRDVFFGSAIFDSISKFECTGFGAVPALCIRIMAENPSAFPSTLRFIMNSGDHLPVSVINQLISLFPSLKIFCAYGLTEITGRFAIMEPEMLLAKMGSVGRPLDGFEVSIRDENKKTLPAGSDGEIYINGPCLMSGYMNNPKLNSQLLSEYGFATGDIGHIDEDGFLFICGRNDDIFKVGGEKVSVKLIEDAVYGMDIFKEIVVIAEYDERIGKIPCLYYVLKQGCFFSERELRKFLKGKVPDTHLPAKYFQVKSIPKTSSGKLLRRNLKMHAID